MLVAAALPAVMVWPLSDDDHFVLLAAAALAKPVARSSSSLSTLTSAGEVGSVELLLARC